MPDPICPIPLSRLKELKRLVDMDNNFCVVCWDNPGHIYGERHAPDCWLKAAIDKAEKPRIKRDSATQTSIECMTHAEHLAGLR